MVVMVVEVVWYWDREDTENAAGASDPYDKNPCTEYNLTHEPHGIEDPHVSSTARGDKKILMLSDTRLCGCGTHADLDAVGAACREGEVVPYGVVRLLVLDRLEAL